MDAQELRLKKIVAAVALESWLEEEDPEVLTADGRALVYTDGRPVALAVVDAIRAIEEVRRDG